MSIFYFGGVIISRERKSQSPDELVNEKIRFKEVLVIDQHGTQLGVLSRNEALNTAESSNLDLVCVSPQATPPVCKIMDYGKYRFEKQKKQKEAKKHQKTIALKEIRLSPVIDKHDMETKLKKTRQMLEKGDKVKVTMRFRGRQITHVEVGQKVLELFMEEIRDVAQIEKDAKLEGRQLFMILAPKK